MEDPRLMRHPVLRLYDLYQRASELVGSKALTIDPYSLDFIKSHHDAMMLFDFRGPGGVRIMGMPVTVSLQWPEPRPGPIASSEVPSANAQTLVRRPFGMYITLTKPNNRVIYVDDPDTEKAFL